MAYRGKFEGGKNGDWVDLVAIDATLSADLILIQNRDTANQVFVVFGGAKPTSKDDGLVLEEGEAIVGSGTAVWVRSSGGYTVAVQDKE